MKKLLLTGFEPFLNFKINPTETIVKDLHEQVIGDYTIVSKVLPVDFEKAGKLLIEYTEEIQPNAIISLGLAGGRYKITPERIAININDGEKDNQGNIRQDELIYESGSDGYFSTLPIRKMVERLTQFGLPAEISNSAGTYLCNHVMYTALHYGRVNQLHIPIGFIHIPASHELAIEHGKIPSWSYDDLKRGVTICIETLSENEHQRNA